jgi:hypothetical protein
MKTHMIQETTTTILVFQTNIETEMQFKTVMLVLNSNAAIQKWNLDQHDVDKVLRVVTDTLHAEDVIELLNNAGLFCAELPD